jgi:hypothetical protein
MKDDETNMKSFLVGIKNVLLWSYERGSWQYDVLCLLIVATIFLVPSSYFGDRDRPPAAQANSIQQTASKMGESMREVEAGELQAFLQRQNRLELTNSPREAITLYLRDQLKRDITDLYYIPLTNSEGRIVYRIWYK